MGSEGYYSTREDYIYQSETTSEIKRDYTGVGSTDQLWCPSGNSDVTLTSTLNNQSWYPNSSSFSYTFN